MDVTPDGLKKNLAIGLTVFVRLRMYFSRSRPDNPAQGAPTPRLGTRLAEVFEAQHRLLRPFINADTAVELRFSPHAICPDYFLPHVPRNSGLEKPGLPRYRIRLVLV